MARRPPHLSDQQVSDEGEYDEDEYDDDPAPVRGPDGRWPTLDRLERAIRNPGPLIVS